LILVESFSNVSKDFWGEKVDATVDGGAHKRLWLLHVMIHLENNPVRQCYLRPNTEPLYLVALFILSNASIVERLLSGSLKNKGKMNVIFLQKLLKISKPDLYRNKILYGVRDLKPKRTTSEARNEKSRLRNWQ
jgi:hypothetical protein